MTRDETARTRAEAISRLYPNPALALSILDPEYTYWSDRGDSTRDEHLDWLTTATDDELRSWLDSIIKDMIASEQICAYCHAKNNGEDVPEIDDDAEWAALALSHGENCEWVRTRAHRN